MIDDQPQFPIFQSQHEKLAPNLKSALFIIAARCFLNKSINSRLFGILRVSLLSQAKSVRTEELCKSINSRLFGILRVSWSLAVGRAQSVGTEELCRLFEILRVSLSLAVDWCFILSQGK